MFDGRWGVTQVRLTQKAVDAVGLDVDAVAWDDDCAGLGLRVQAGRRSWIVRYRVAGVSRQKTLPGALPLKQARVRAAEIRTGAAGGVDIVAKGRAAAEEVRRLAEAARARSLAVIAEHYLTDAARRLRPASLGPARLYLRQHWRALHDRPADELTRREIVAVLEPWAGRRTALSDAAPPQRMPVLGLRSAGWLERNTALGIRAPVAVVPRARALSEAELGSVLAAAGSPDLGGARREFRAALRMLALTAARRREVTKMAWSEIDWERAMWNLPGERSKNGKPHTVPLSLQAVALLRERAAPHGRGLVFGIRGNGVTKWTRDFAKFAKPLALPHWTTHDLRRTAVTGMAELGISPHIIEAVVNHQSGHKAGMAGVYNRAEYSQEKRAASATVGRSP